jgi:hypothetical protein
MGPALACTSGLFYRRPVAYIQIQGSCFVEADFPFISDSQDTVSLKVLSPVFALDAQAKKIVS